jgi:4-hydroxy-tetrahydrodipicolinate synthase
MAGDWHGIFPYLVSPIDEATGGVREAILRDLVEHLIASGVHGLTPLGSTGEFAYLTFAQKREIVRIVVEATRGRVPVVAGVAAFASHDAIAQARAFVELGADGIVAVLQYMFPVTEAGAEGYFRAIAAAVPCPIVLYSNPGLVGGDLSPALIERLSAVPNIAYVKDASGETGRILSILNRCGERIKVFSASAHIPLIVFELGGVGWMAGPACIMPVECVRLYDLFRAGRQAEALALQRRLWRVNEVFQRHSLAACIKAALTLQGFAVGGPIAPQQPLAPAAIAEIAAALRQLDAPAGE